MYFFGKLFSLDFQDYLVDDSPNIEIVGQAEYDAYWIWLPFD